MSDDSDSDYNPNEAEDVNEHEEETVQLTAIPTFRKNITSALFEEMQNEDKEFVQKVKAKTGLKSASASTSTAGGGGLSKSAKKKLSVLSSIFGGSQAAALVETAESKKRSRVDAEADIKSAAQEAARKVQRNMKVSETVKFAGQEISVQKTVMSTAQPVVAKPVSALDKVLDELKGPKVISTVTKSSIDWDNFKEKEGLEDDLAVAAKDGYLHRKDFLDRCDVRAFETERDLRIQNSSKSAPL